MKKHETKAARREQAMAALLTYPTIRDAAGACNQAEVTLRRYLADPDFRAEYDARRRQMVEAACGVLQTRMGAAADTLAELMDCPAVPPQTRLGAARMILEFGLKTVEVLDILPRLEALEDAQKRENDRQ